jgi:hypothetical protein
MRRVGPMLIFLLPLAGCGSARYEDLAREQTELNEGVLKLWTGVTDEATMTAAGPKLIADYRRLNALSREAKRLGKPPAAVNDELGEKYGRRLQDAVNQILEEQRRILELPGGRDFLKKVKTASEAAD